MKSAPRPRLNARRALTMGLLAAALSGSAAGCRRSATQLVFRVEADEDWSAWLNSVQIELRDFDRNELIEQIPYDLRTLHRIPMERGLVARDATEHGRVEAIVRGTLASGGAPIEQRAIVAFDPGHVLRVTLYLAQGCAVPSPVMCPAGNVCGRGARCEPIYRNSVEEILADGTSRRRDVDTSDIDATTDASAPDESSDDAAPRDATIDAPDAGDEAPPVDVPVDLAPRIDAGSPAEACAPSCGGLRECGDNGCGGSCGTCDAGMFCSASQLCQMTPYRLLAPSSTSTVTRARATVRWSVASGAAPASHTQFCRDRAMTRDCVTSLISPPSCCSATTDALAPGQWFWRVGRDDAGAWSRTRQLRVGHNASSGPSTSWGAELDLNGDGSAEIAARVNSTTGPGRVDIYRWSGSEISRVATLTPPGGFSVTQFGRRLAPAGDVDGDGYADLAVAMLIAAPATPAIMREAVAVYFGEPDAPTTVSRPPQLVEAPSGDRGFGVQVSAGGDLNGDGYGELLVSVNSSGTPARGAVRVYRGGPAGLTMVDVGGLALREDVATSNAGFGLSIAAVGDLDADGLDDFVVGAPNAQNGMVSAGAVWVFFGDSETVVAPDSTRLTGDSPPRKFGTTVTALGDTNADGYVDFAVSAVSTSSGDPSNVFIVRGGTGRATLAPRPRPFIAGMNGFGTVLRATGDSDHDGFDDLVLASPALGQVILVYGAAGTTLSAGPPLTMATTTGFGATLGGGGDVDNDGYVDFVVGAPSLPNRTSGQPCGGFFLYSGGPRSAPPPLRGSAEGTMETDLYGGTLALRRAGDEPLRVASWLRALLAPRCVAPGPASPGPFAGARRG